MSFLNRSGPTHGASENRGQENILALVRLDSVSFDTFIAVRMARSGVTKLKYSPDTNSAL